LDYQPRPGISPRKGQRDRLIALTQQQPDWVLGFADETCWSRVTQPQVQNWTTAADGPLRLVEQDIPKADPDRRRWPAMHLRLRQIGRPERVWLRFVDGRPVRVITEQFLGWCCDNSQEVGERVGVLIWDNASWHVSKRVRTWIRAYNRQVKKQGHGVRILSCFLPVKSLWLKPVEPKWVHGKRAIVEPTRLLSA
jgi:hypothetical protein